MDNDTWKPWDGRREGTAPRASSYSSGVLAHAQPSGEDLGESSPTVNASSDFAVVQIEWHRWYSEGCFGRQTESDKSCLAVSPTSSS